MGIRTTVFSGVKSLASTLTANQEQSVTPASAQSAPSRKTPRELDLPRQRWSDAGPRSRLMTLEVMEALSQKKLKGTSDDGSSSSQSPDPKPRKGVTFKNDNEVKIFDNTKPPAKISKPHIRFDAKEDIRTFDNTKSVLDISKSRKKVTFKKADDVRRFDKEKPAIDVGKPYVKPILKKDI